MLIPAGGLLAPAIIKVSAHLGAGPGAVLGRAVLEGAGHN